MGEIVLCMLFFGGLFFIQHIFEGSEKKIMYTVAVVYMITFPVLFGLLGRVFE